VKSAGKPVYGADNIHKVIFIKNLLDYSDDYARSAAKSQFWYLDNDATNVTSDAATNLGICARGLLSHGGLTTEIIIPLNRYSFFEELSDRLLPPMQLEFEIVLQDDDELIFQNDGTGRRIVVRKFELWVPQLTLTSEGQKQSNENFLKPTKWIYLKETLHPSSSRRGASGSWLITPGVKNPKHMFVFFQQTRKQNALTQNPYLFDTFELYGDSTAKLSTCCLQYGTGYYPEIDYDDDFKLRILNDREKITTVRAPRCKSPTFQNFTPSFTLTSGQQKKKSVTGDSKSLTLHYQLNEGANAQDYTIYPAVLNEEDVVVKQRR